MTAPSLLRTLCATGVAIRLEGDRVYLVPGPAGVPHEMEARLRKVESDVVSLLRTGSWMLQAPLPIFAQCQVAIEIHVPDLPETIWFASDAAQVERLIREGVRRGGIWTAEELSQLWAAGPPPFDEVVGIARTKLAFNSVLTDVGRRAPTAPATTAAEPTQASLDLGIARPPEVD
ncbi:MAG: hypothetical protein ACREAA_02750 [Candidatus Polarisedimenticolia bacterium]